MWAWSREAATRWCMRWRGGRESSIRCWRGPARSRSSRARCTSRSWRPSQDRSGRSGGSGGSHAPGVLPAIARSGASSCAGGGTFRMGHPLTPPRRPATPRLGIVSPAALRPQSGRAAELVRTDRSGTGPFELRERERERIVIARNVAWWGIRLDLGPALDQVEFRVVPTDPERLGLLRGGTAQVADSLPRVAVGEIRRDPLITFLTGGGGDVLGLERSVRGLESPSAIEPLSEV